MLHRKPPGVCPVCTLGTFILDLAGDTDLNLEQTLDLIARVTVEMLADHVASSDSPIVVKQELIQNLLDRFLALIDLNIEEMKTEEDTPEPTTNQVGHA